MQAFVRRLPFAAAVLLCSCAGAREEQDVVALIREERYDEAVRIAARAAEQAPHDEEAAALHRDATLAWILNEGRQAIFERRREDALELFNEALELAPDNPAVAQWHQKTLDELTGVWLETGLEYILRDEMDKALEAYEIALHYSPGNIEARIGIARALLLINYRHGMGESYYNEGVRAIHEHFYRTARSRFGYTQKYVPGDERAAMRKEQVESALAEERLFVAEQFEQQGLYGAAMNEYRLVLLLEPENEAAKESYERMRRESEAERVLAAADLLVRQGRIEEARKIAEQGQRLTSLQTDQFTTLLNSLEGARWEALYQKAVSLERDFRYEEAVAAYDELLAEAEFYEDAVSRRDTLKEYIAQAAELYEQMLQAGDPEEQLALLREIEFLWPEYRDIQARIHELTQGK